MQHIMIVNLKYHLMHTILSLTVLTAFISTELSAQVNSFKAVRVKLKNGQVKEGRNAEITHDLLMFKKARPIDKMINYYGRAETVYYKFENIEAISYSNRNWSLEGTLAGLLTGLTLIFTSEGDIIYTWLFSTPLMVLAGNAIGGSIYTDWKSYDPGDGRHISTCVFRNFKFNNFQIGIKIPLDFYAQYRK